MAPGVLSGPMHRWQEILGTRAGRVGAALGVVMLAALAFGILDLWSLVVTVGGALGVAAATFPRERLERCWRLVPEALAGDGDAEALVGTMKRLARVHRMEGARALERAAAADGDAFVRRAAGLAAATDDVDLLNDQLVAEARREIAGIEDARHVMATLGRLFPAFGLIGTLIGLGLLLRHLQGGTLSTLGPGLALAVQTTLYGAVLSNAVVLPIATRLHAHAARRTRWLQTIVDGAGLIARRAYPSQVEAVLRAHLGVSAPEVADAAPLRLAERAA